MGRARDPKRNEAMRLYLISEGSQKPKDLAKLLKLPSATIRKWKSEDRWDDELKKPLPERNIPKRKKGPPYGSQNALGHDGHKAGNPKGNPKAKGPGFGNTNALKTGEYSKMRDEYFTDEELQRRERAKFDPVMKIRATIDEQDKRRQIIGSMMENLKTDKSILIEERKTISTDSDGNIDSKEISQIAKPLYDGYIKMSDALTRVDTSQIKAIETLIKIGGAPETKKTSSYEEVMEGLSLEELRQIARCSEAE